MNKHYLIKQPPLVDFTTFLVDYISDNKYHGITTDVDKITYNLNLMEDEFNQELEIGLNFSKNGINDVTDLGKYIAVVSLRKDKKEGKINFFDSTAPIKRKELKKQMSTLYDKIITDKFLEIYDILTSSSLEDSSTVRLFKPID